MNIADLKNVILDCCNDVIFTYNGKKSGVTAEVNDSVPTFQVWHGSDMKNYKDVDALLSDEFFSGKSINDLADKINFTIA